MAVVYRHIRLDKNEPFYIGIGKSKHRAYSKNNRNLYWNNIVNKSIYEVELLFENVSYEFAKEKEVEMISLYGRKDLKLGSLVNLTDGGDGILNYVHTDKTKNKISDSHLGKEFSEESKKKMSLSKSGDLSPTKQKWVRDKISKTLTGFKRGSFSKEHLHKLSAIKKKPVIDIKTNIEYDSFKDACSVLGLKYQTEYSRFNNNTKLNRFIRK